MASTQARYDAGFQKLTSAGQQHVIAFWRELTDPQRRLLLHDIDQVDLAASMAHIPNYVLRRPEPVVPRDVRSPEVLPATPRTEQRDEYAAARDAGDQAIRAGCVAAFTVAGGQGTRLGYDGPKGMFAISPVRSATLFRWFAEYLAGIGRRFGRVPPWYIMTSPTNHATTTDYFEEHAYFGLSRRDVTFFSQRQMPAFLPDGRIALAEKHRLALSPDGHGGSVWALRSSGALEDMRRRGVDYISYFQVDNPLVHCIDPLFIGLHIRRRSEMSSKAVAKADDLERVGNFCIADGRLQIIEYSDFPEQLARARNADGSRTFDAGSIAVHVLDRGFVERLTSPDSAVALPWHRAEKKVAVVHPDDATGTPVPTTVIKLEMFIFDAIPLARNPLVLYTPREEEFSPVKNAEGVDSPATARRDMVRRAARWLEACGCTVPRDGRGEPAMPIEIIPAFALDADDLRTRLHSPPTLKPGEPFLLA